MLVINQLKDSSSGACGLNLMALLGRVLDIECKLIYF